jgi:predicted nucleotidyltransferase
VRMASIIYHLNEQGLLRPPKWLESNVMYETVMGSVAYGVSSDSSDNDIYGFCIPPKAMVFPHLAGEIEGFGRNKQRFEQFLADHIEDKSAGKLYDITIYSIVKYFMLLMENNPNIIDSIYTPQFCVRHITKVGQIVRDNRKLFLHKGSWHKFKGYAYQQLHKMKTKSPEMGSKRAALIEQFGYDVKFAYHVVRLLDEAEQILVHGDIDLQRAREHMKAIRKGEVAEEEVRQFFTAKEKQLEQMYADSKVQHSPDEAKIKSLLLSCLEEHYGNLKDAVVVEDAAKVALREVAAVIDRNRKVCGLDG